MPERIEIFEKLPDGVTIHAPDDGSLLNANEEFCEMLGYSRAELRELAFDDLHPDEPPYTSDRARAYLRRAVSEGPQTFEWMDQTKDGELVPVEVNLRVTTIDGDERILAVVRDITDRKERERKITALHDIAQDLGRCDSPERVYRLLVDAAEDILDHDRVIVDKRQGDVLVPAAVSSGLAEDQYYHRTPIDAADNIAARAFRSGESSVIDDLRDHGLVPAQSGYRAVLTVPIGDHGVFQAASTEVATFDTTDLELAELLCGHARNVLTNLKRRSELSRQNRQLEEFARVVSHDLRNPLNVIEGHVELAREECEGDALAAISRAARRMDELIDNLLTLARTGGEVGEREPVELDEIANTCWGNVETAAASLSVETKQVIVANRSQIQQLLENLFRNAVEHNGSAITITVGELDAGSGFSVSDDGSGIDEAIRDRVFEAGYSMAEGGTGFGLSIVRQIAEAHEWTIDLVESGQGGARFEFRDVQVVPPSYHGTQV